MKLTTKCPALPHRSRLFSQIKEFSKFLQPKCTQSCAVSMDDFAKRDFPMQDSDVGMAADDASRMISSVIVKQGGARVALFRGAETHTRSILKAISWRTLGTLDTFAISWFFTGKVEIAGSIAGLEIVTKIAWYYLHERVWAAVSWGRR